MASDKEYWQYSTSVSKALNMTEAPLKIKHARFIIITTHHLKECNSLWKLLSNQPLMENRFSAWKFCHLLHKVLREGHNSSIKHSQSHKKMITEMGKMWGHLDDLGTCIQAYSKLLVVKLDFHEKNSVFPGSLTVSFKDIDKYAGNDINVYFQLCVEIFDYLDEILAVQNYVFHSVNTFRMFSMSSPAQCRLAPLVTLIQDSNPLYDFCVRIMFKLHDNLPGDVLSGHRSRFAEIFSKLKLFYEKVRPLQYFEDLIQVPYLPESAPNFSSELDFGNYVAPVLTVPESVSKPDLENLVDISMPEGLESTTELPEKARYEQIIYAKELEIERIADELVSFKESCNIIKEKHQIEMNELTGQINDLREELEFSNQMCEEMRKEVAGKPALFQKNSEMEERTRLQEEKFNKFKAMYSEIREEHIKLLRQNGETNKQLNLEKKLVETLQSENCSIKEEIEILRKQFETKNIENINLEKLLKTSSCEIDSLEEKCSELKNQVEFFKDAEGSKTNEMSEMLNQLKQKKDELNENQAKIFKLEIDLKIEKTQAENKTKEYDNIITRLNLELEKINSSIREINISHNLKSNEKQSEIQNLQEGHKTVLQQLQQKDLELKQLNNISEKKMQEIHELKEEVEEKYQKALRDVELITKEKNEKDIKNMQLIIFILSCFLNASSILTTEVFTKTDQSVNRSSFIINKIKSHIEAINEMHKMSYLEEKNIHNFIQSILTVLKYFTNLHESCSFTYRTTIDIENGEKLWGIMLSLSDPIQTFLSGIMLKNSRFYIEKSSENVCTKLKELDDVFYDITQNLHSNLELAEIIESELKTMERTILEASQKFLEMIEHTKSRDNGIKLEVNEKILDACTTLIESIMRLIKRAKILQDEIVSSGRGNVSVGEFYKRNSEWTEGLISAAKSIAKGANFLVEAANKAVSIESSHNMDIIVAAQEIAACTAQLVVASKVKASNNSSNLLELTKASRLVSQATGAVVAIVKDNNERIELYNEIDVCKLTSSQAKTMEMNIQVRVLELEQALQTERLKLSSFRKNLYKNSED